MVSYGDMRNLDQTKITDADLIVIGASVFYYDIPDYVKDFIIPGGTPQVVIM